MERLSSYKCYPLLIFLGISFLFLSNNSWSQKIVFENQMKIYGFDYYIDTVIIAQEEQNFPGHSWVGNQAYPFTINKKSITQGLQDYFNLCFPYDH